MARLNSNWGWIGGLLACFFVTAFTQAEEVRLWQDASGRFQVRASLLSQSEDSVRLKAADGRELTVPIDRLSSGDQQYLKSLLAPSDNPFAGGTLVPEAALSVPSSGPVFSPSASAGDTLALPDTGTTVDLASGATVEFRVDPAASPSGIPGGTVSVSSVDAYDKISGPLLASRDGITVLTGIGRHQAGKPNEARGRIFAVNMSSRQADLVWDRPSATQVWAHDVASGNSLVLDKIDAMNRGGELLMVQGLVSGAANVLYTRTLPGAGRPGFAPQVQWAHLLGAGHALVMVNDTVYLWDLPAAQLLYRIERVGNTTPPTLSPGGRYLAVPTNGGATVIEIASGQVCGQVSGLGTLKPGLAFHDDGKQLLLCAGNQFLVWDCEAGVATAQATTTEQLGARPLHWIGPKMFRSQLGALVHVELGMAVWKYSLTVSADPLVVGDKLLVATSRREASLVAVDIPHAAADNALRRLFDAGDAAMLVTPGSSVAVAIESSVAGVDQGQIEASLGESIHRAGWKVDSNAPIKLVAKIGRGEPQELNFRNIGQGPLASGSKATLNPFTAELEIRRGSDVLWKRQSANHVPMILRLEEGETVQDAVKRFEKPNPEFFSALNLPPRIPKPELSSQIGMSTLADGTWRDLAGGNQPPARPLRPRR